MILKVFMLIIICLLILISLCSICGLVLQDQYELIRFTNYWQKLTQTIEPDKRPDLAVNLYFLILIGFIGIVFTALSIHLSKKKISVLTFFEDIFVTQKENIILAIICLINSIVIFFSGYFRYTFLLDLFILLSVIPIVCLSLSTIKLFKITEKEETAVRLLTNLIKTDSKKTEAFLQIIIDEFPNTYPNMLIKSFSAALKKLTDEKRKIVIGKNIELVTKLYKQFQNSFDELVVSIKFLCNFENLLFETNTDNTMKFKVLTFIFDNYKKLVSEHKQKIEVSYILEIRESAYDFYFTNNSTFDEVAVRNFTEYYTQLMTKVKDLIVFSLYYVQKKVVELELEDFFAMIQFMQHDQKLNNLSKKEIQYDVIYQHSLFCVEIMTRIMNFVLIGKIDIAYLDLLEYLYYHCNYFVIFDFSDYIMYKEPFESIDFHPPKFTNNFFIACILLYFTQHSEKKILLADILNAMHYEPLHKKPQCNSDGFMSILRQIDEIDEKYLKILSVTKETIDTVKNGLLEKIKPDFEISIAQLEKENIDKKLHDELLKLKTRISEQVKELFSTSHHKYEAIENKQILKIQFQFSKKGLAGSSFLFDKYSHCSYKSQIIEYMYIEYCKKAELLTVTDLKQIEISEQDTLILPITLLDFLYTQDTSYFYTDELYIDKKKIQTHFMRKNYNSIIKLSDLLDYIRIADNGITISADKPTETKKIQLDSERQYYDITVESTIDVMFQQYVKKPHTMYKIIF